MGYPRHLRVPPGVAGVYHCHSRCVRRAFLCGEDPVTGRRFDHRKAWLEERIVELAGLFAVAVHAYAVMSNHVHVVVETDPEAPQRWSDEEVARRWLALCPGGEESDVPLEARIAHLAACPERLEELRRRLGSLSWFMRCLKEPIARRANREDGCTGRFWEGRFATQALLDDAALLACMVYVDLNPVRAGVVETPETARHTSVRRRAQAAPISLKEPLAPVLGSVPGARPALSAAAYLDLVAWTGRSLHGEAPSDEAPPVLAGLGLRPRQWLMQVPATESRYWRAIGRADAMLERARALGVRWLRGIGTARALERVADTA